MHVKLDELIRANENANNDLLSAEDDTVEELADLKQRYDQLCKAHDALSQQVSETARG